MHLSHNTPKRINYYTSSGKKSVLLCGQALPKHFKSTFLRCERLSTKINHKIAMSKLKEEIKNCLLGLIYVYFCSIKESRFCSEMFPSVYLKNKQKNSDITQLRKFSQTSRIYLCHAWIKFTRCTKFRTMVMEIRIKAFSFFNLQEDFGVGQTLAGH